MRVPTAARRAATLLVVLALVVAVAAVLPRWWALVRPVPPTPVDPASVAGARAALPALRVTEALPLEGYRREHFGEPWADVDGNGCDTRNDVLARWLTEVELDPGQPCLVVAGTLRDPYTGHLIAFARGPTTSAEVQIDHVVALADAWSKGAAAWPAHLAVRFANDPANLVPTGGATNQDKGAADAASWLPPDDGFHCAYAVAQITVKAAYGLGVSSEEHGALAAALARCPPDASTALSAPADSLDAAGWTDREGRTERHPEERRRSRCSHSRTARSSSRPPTS